MLSKEENILFAAEKFLQSWDLKVLLPVRLQKQQM
jgi:hypothetical protein